MGQTVVLTLTVLFSCLSCILASDDCQPCLCKSSNVDCSYRNITWLPSFNATIRNLTLEGNPYLIITRSSFENYTLLQHLVLPNAYITLNVSKLFAKNPQLDNGGFSGQDLFKNNVKLVEIHELMVDYIPVELFSPLAALEDLRFSTQQSTLDGDMFKNSINLNTLHIIANNITELPGTLLKPIEKSLKSLQLVINNVMSLPPELLSNARMLETIVIEGAKLTLPCPLLSSKIYFLETISLRSLPDISECNIEEIGNHSQVAVEIVNAGRIQCPTTALPSQRLTNLTITYSNLTSLAGGCVSNILDVVEMVNFSHNSIVTLDLWPGVRPILRAEYIDLSYNLIPSISKGGGELPSLFHSSRLKELYLQYNNISYVEREIFENMDNLVTLRMDHNNIHTVAAFTNPSLVSVDLSYNDISMLPDGMFQRCNKLEILDLQHNNVKAVPGSILNSDQLVLVNLQNNSITKISSSFIQFDSCKSNPRIDLTGNHLICGCFIQVARRKCSTLVFEGTCYHPPTVAGAQIQDIVVPSNPHCLEAFYSAKSFHSNGTHIMAVLDDGDKEWVRTDELTHNGTHFKLAQYLLYTDSLALSLSNVTGYSNAVFMDRNNEVFDIEVILPIQASPSKLKMRISEHQEMELDNVNTTSLYRNHNLLVSGLLNVSMNLPEDITNISLSSDGILRFSSNEGALVEYDMMYNYKVLIRNDSITVTSNDGDMVVEVQTTTNSLRLEANGLLVAESEPKLSLDVSHLTPVVDNHLLLFVTSHGKEVVVVDSELDSIHVKHDSVEATGEDINVDMQLSGDIHINSSTAVIKRTDIIQAVISTNNESSSFWNESHLSLGRLVIDAKGVVILDGGSAEIQVVCNLTGKRSVFMEHANRTYTVVNTTHVNVKRSLDANYSGGMASYRIQGIPIYDGEIISFNVTDLTSVVILVSGRIPIFSKNAVEFSGIAGSGQDHNITLLTSDRYKHINKTHIVLKRSKDSSDGDSFGEFAVIGSTECTNSTCIKRSNETTTAVVELSPVIMRKMYIMEYYTDVELDEYTIDEGVMGNIHYDGVREIEIADDPPYKYVTSGFPEIHNTSYVLIQDDHYPFEITIDDVTHVKSTTNKISFLLQSSVERFSVAAPGILYYYTQSNHMLIKGDVNGTTATFTGQFLPKSINIEHTINVNHTVLVFDTSFSRVCPPDSILYIPSTILERSIVYVMRNRSDVCTTIYGIVSPILVKGRAVTVNHAKDIKGSYSVPGRPKFSRFCVLFNQTSTNDDISKKSQICPGGLLNIEPFVLKYIITKPGSNGITTLEWPHSEQEGVVIGSGRYPRVAGYLINLRTITKVTYDHRIRHLALFTSEGLFAWVSVPITICRDENRTLQILERQSNDTVITISQQEDYTIVWSTDSDELQFRSGPGHISPSQLFQENWALIFEATIVRRSNIKIGLLNISTTDVEFSSQGDQLAVALSDRTAVLLAVSNHSMIISNGSTFYLKLVDGEYRLQTAVEADVICSINCTVQINTDGSITMGTKRLPSLKGIREIVLSDRAVKFYNTRGHLHQTSNVSRIEESWRATLFAYGVPHYNGSHVNYILPGRNLEAVIRVVKESVKTEIHMSFGSEKSDITFCNHSCEVNVLMDTTQVLLTELLLNKTHLIYGPRNESLYLPGDVEIKGENLVISQQDSVFTLNSTLPASISVNVVSEGVRIVYNGTERQVVLNGITDVKIADDHFTISVDNNRDVVVWFDEVESLDSQTDCTVYRQASSKIQLCGAVATQAPSTSSTQTPSTSNTQTPTSNTQAPSTSSTQAWLNTTSTPIATTIGMLTSTVDSSTTNTADPLFSNEAIIKVTVQKSPTIVTEQLNTQPITEINEPSTTTGLVSPKDVATSQIQTTTTNLLKPTTDQQVAATTHYTTTTGEFRTATTREVAAPLPTFTSRSSSITLLLATAAGISTVAPEPLTSGKHLSIMLTKHMPTTTRSSVTSAHHQPVATATPTTTGRLGAVESRPSAKTDPSQPPTTGLSTTSANLDPATITQPATSAEVHTGAADTPKSTESLTTTAANKLTTSLSLHSSTTGNTFRSATKQPASVENVLTTLAKDLPSPPIASSSLPVGDVNTNSVTQSVSTKLDTTTGNMPISITQQSASVDLLPISKTSLPSFTENLNSITKNQHTTSSNLHPSITGNMPTSATKQPTLVKDLPLVSTKDFRTPVANFVTTMKKRTTSTEHTPAIVTEQSTTRTYLPMIPSVSKVMTVADLVKTTIEQATVTGRHSTVVVQSTFGAVDLHSSIRDKSATAAKQLTTSTKYHTVTTHLPTSPTAVFNGLSKATKTTFRDLGTATVDSNSKMQPSARQSTPFIASPSHTAGASASSVTTTFPLTSVDLEKPASDIPTATAESRSSATSFEPSAVFTGRFSLKGESSSAATAMPPSSGHTTQKTNSVSVSISSKQTVNTVQTVSTPGGTETIMASHSRTSQLNTAAGRTENLNTTAPSDYSITSPNTNGTTAKNKLITETKSIDNTRTVTGDNTIRYGESLPHPKENSKSNQKLQTAYVALLAVATFAIVGGIVLLVAYKFCINKGESYTLPDEYKHIPLNPTTSGQEHLID